MEEACVDLAIVFEDALATGLVVTPVTVVVGTVGPFHLASALAQLAEEFAFVDLVGGVGDSVSVFSETLFERVLLRDGFRRGDGDGAADDDLFAFIRTGLFGGGRVEVVAVFADLVVAHDWISCWIGRFSQLFIGLYSYQ